MAEEVKSNMVFIFMLGTGKRIIFYEIAMFMNSKSVLRPRYRYNRETLYLVRGDEMENLANQLSYSRLTLLPKLSVSKK
jgi:hypothetical protein